jgi:hypothetical protein
MPAFFCSNQANFSSVQVHVLKVHKHEIFCLTFLAETETIRSQGPVTRDF